MDQEFPLLGCYVEGSELLWVAGKGFWLWLFVMLGVNELVGLECRIGREMHARTCSVL
jgi:hypothetical protein